MHPRSLPHPSCRPANAVSFAPETVTPHLAFVNNPELFQKINYIPPVGKSDHLLLDIQTSIKRITKRLVTKIFVDYRSIRADLCNFNWDNILVGHMEDKWNIFKPFFSMRRNSTHRLRWSPNFNPTINYQGNQEREEPKIPLLEEVQKEGGQS